MSVSSELTPVNNTAPHLSGKDPAAENLISSRDILVLFFAGLFSMVVYCSWSYFTYRIGFPLDDSWIHQTYARNLAKLGEWSFLPGITSAGSTAPLWTVWLSVGFLLNLPPIPWSIFSGVVQLFATALLMEMILRHLIPQYAPIFPWAGCLFALEWHMVWAAFSGMETGLYIFLVLLVFRQLLLGSKKFLITGILIGTAIWVRPDGLTLLIPIFLYILIDEKSISIRLKNIVWLTFGFSLFFFPYLFFNLAISGSPMPNTFYAKQMEYAAWQAAPIIERFFYFLLQFFQGVSIILIPGFIQKLVSAFQKKNWAVLLTALWIFGYIILYISRLPVYQHGRYLMPALSVFILLGLSGFIESISYIKSHHYSSKQVVYINSVIVILTLSFFFGAVTYAQDVAFIESQMVETAKWVSNNIPAKDNIAAHDIGALGYFGKHNIVDLAGLITPEVVPIMNDDQQLLNYLDAQHVNYLIAFPSWHPNLSSNDRQVFITTDSRFLQNQNSGMAVFQRNLP